MDDAAGIGDGGGITERAGGIGGGAVVLSAAIVGLLAIVRKTMYHIFLK